MDVVGGASRCTFDLLRFNVSPDHKLSSVGLCFFLSKPDAPQVSALIRPRKPRVDGGFLFGRAGGDRVCVTSGRRFGSGEGCAIPGRGASPLTGA